MVREVEGGGKTHPQSVEGAGKQAKSAHAKSSRVQLSLFGARTGLFADLSDVALGLPVFLSPFVGSEVRWSAPFGWRERVYSLWTGV